MSNVTSRRVLLKQGAALAMATGLGGTLAACGGGSGGGSSANTIRFQLKWLKTAESAGFWIADDEGLYRDEDLKSEFQAGGPNIANTVPIVEGGNADIGQEELYSIVSGVTKGADIVAIGTVFQTGPLSIISLSDAPVTEASDLIGTRVGVQQGSKQAVDALLKVNDLPPDYDLVPVSFDPAPLVEGACDAYVGFATNQAITLETQNIDHVVTTFAAMGMPSYSGTLFGKRDWLNDNRDLVVRWLRASIRGWQKNVDDPTLGATLAVEKYGRTLGLDQEQQELQSQAQVPLTQSPLTEKKGLLYVSKEEVAGAIYDGFRASGITNPPPVDEVIDTSFLEEAYDGKTTL